MKKKVNIQNDEGIIQIHGDFQEAVLYLKNQPYQYTWFAEVGSTARFHIAKSLPKNSIKKDIHIQEIVKKGITTKEEFFAVVSHYKQFLGRGTYEFGYYKLHTHHDWINIPEGNDFQHFHYYGGCPHIIPMQNYVDDNYVEFYTEQIKRRLNPLMVILHNEDSYINFILEGHHKFRAYSKSKVEPHALIVTKLYTYSMGVFDALELAKRMDCHDERYLNTIKSEKQNKLFSMKLNLNTTFVKVDLL